MKSTYGNSFLKHVINNKKNSLSNWIGIFQNQNPNIPLKQTNDDTGTIIDNVFGHLPKRLFNKNTQQLSQNFIQSQSQSGQLQEKEN